MLVRCIVVFMLLFAPSAHALWCGQSDGCSVDMIGSLRLTGGYLRYSKSLTSQTDSHDWIGATISRIIARGSGFGLRYELNVFHEYSDLSESGIEGVYATAGLLESVYRHDSLTDRYAEDGSASGFYGIDRLALTADFGPSVTAGRFPINFSVTSLFAPNDFFAPFSTTAINKIYKPGVDGIRLSVPLGMLSGAELVGILGHEQNGPTTWNSSALLGRIGTVIWGAEWATLGGKTAERWVVGGSVQSDLSILTGRGEWHIGFPDREPSAGDDGNDQDDPYIRCAAGFDTMWMWRNASLAVEYLFLSDGSGDADDYLIRAHHFFPDDLNFFGKHYAGLTSGFDLLPIVRFQALSYLNACDGSGIVSAMFDWSAADEISLVGGVVAAWGDDSFEYDSISGIPTIGSEYGISPSTAYLEARIYF